MDGHVMLNSYIPGLSTKTLALGRVAFDASRARGVVRGWHVFIFSSVRSEDRLDSVRMVAYGCHCHGFERYMGNIG